MNRIGIPILAFGALAAGAGANPAPEASPKRPPNILFILADDLGYGDLGCYGGRGVRTRNIDRLAAEGIRFTQFYASSPICSPSRTGFLTGQYPARWRVTSFISDRAANRRRGMAQWLDPKAPSLTRSLKERGYTTGHFGKWHMGGGRDVGEAPLISAYGFDASLTQFEGLGDRVLPVMSTAGGQPGGKLGLGLASEKLGRGKVRWVPRSEVTKAFVDGALGFIREADRDGKPFYVNLWPDDVHSPFDPPAARRGDGSKQDLYRGVLDTMDEQLGPLIEEIRKNPRLRDNTLIVFASDNGPEPGAGTAGALCGSKGMLYEGGIRVPFITWGPGLLAEGRRGSTDRASVLSAVDLAPSILALAGAKPLAAPDGENLGAAMLGRSDAGRKGPLFWKRPPDRPGPPRAPLPDLAMRDGRWKLLLEEDGSNPRLFDLEADPGETKDRAQENADTVRRMKKSLLDWNAALPPGN